MTDEQNSALVNLKTGFLDTLGRMAAVAANGERDSAVLDAMFAPHVQRANEADPEVRKAFEIWLRHHDAEEVGFRNYLRALATGKITERH
jgi:hypothetical protein